MNTPSTNLTILHDTQEWSTDIEGEIGEIRVEVEGIAQSIKTLVLCLGVIVTVCLVCNIGMATWVATHDDEIMEAVDGTIKRNSVVMDRMARLNNIYAKKLQSMGLIYRDGNWQQIGNNPVNPSK